MKLILFSLLTIVLFSCTKEDNTTRRCYECDIKSNGTYYDAGCYTSAGWRAVVYDMNGNKVDKSKCRVK